MNKMIAVIDDEADIVELETQALKKEGFAVKSYSDGDSFLYSLVSEKPLLHLILLDIMLPGTNGNDILKFLRSHEDYAAYKKVPVILVSARDTEVDKVLGLEIGADDYIAKPFSPRELTARVKAVLRRFEDPDTPGSSASSVIRVGAIHIDEKRFQVSIEDTVVELTTAEFKILATLARRKGWVFDRNKLIDSIWGGDKYVTDRTIDVHIKHLREKLGKHGSLIKTLRGVGYKIEEE